MDRDGGQVYGEICSYRIENNSDDNNNLFSIDNAGDVRLVSALDSALSRSHVLSVSAVDCGGREMDKEHKAIAVVEVCELVNREGRKGLAVFFLLLILDSWLWQDNPLMGLPTKGS